MTSPLSIITSGRWKHALFTTYALSLSFFETYLLRAGLKRNGCTDIWLVADADGYNASLAEKQASSVGVDYRLVSVALPRGVFHPKCVYLSGDDRDLLIIGSGNLTFGGHGRNIEVFEVFSSDIAPSVFGEFASFLEALAKRHDFMNPDPTWLATFAGLARTAATGQPAGAPPVQSAHLVHCVEFPIEKQLKDVFEKHGGARAIRMLSPFYDNDANAVSRLSQNNPSATITIGLTPGHADDSTFPFTKHTLGTRLHAAHVGHPHASMDRPLHAKWIEAELGDQNKLTLTGSVNATRQSLCTNNNIEAGIIRIEAPPFPERLAWARIPLPKSCNKQNYRPPGLRGRLMLHARLTQNLALEGLIIPAQNATGTWQAQLIQGDGATLPFTLSVGDTGAFKHSFERDTIWENATCLQLKLSRTTPVPAEISGWVHNDILLELSRLSQLPASTILNQIRGFATEEDDLLLQDLLATGLPPRPPRATTPTADASTNDTGQPSGNDSFTIPIAAAAVEEGALASGSGMSRHLHMRTLDDLFARIISRAFAPESPTATRRHQRSLQFEQDSDDNDTPIAPTGTPPIDTPQTQPAKSSHNIDRVLSLIRDKIIKAPDSPQREIRLQTWLAVALQFYYRKMDSAENEAGQTEHWESARQFARDWLLCVKSLHSHDQRARRDAGLSRTVIQIAAILAANASGSPESTKTFVLIKDALRGFFNDSIPAIHGEHLKTIPLLLTRLLHESSSDVPAAIQQVMRARTRAEEAIMLIQAIQAREPLAHDDLAILKTPMGQELQRNYKAGRMPGLHPASPSATACPKCHMRLRPDALRNISEYRLCHCLDCDTYLHDNTLVK